MARTTSTNYSTPSFPKASADTDPFDAFDVQQLAAAVDGHDHSSGKGLTTSIPAGSITSGMIADGTIVAGDLADGAVTSAKILDATIATGDLANNAVTNAKLASDTARANLLVNGGFNVWQRGNGPFTGNNTWTADRWQIGLAGSDTLSVSRDAVNIDSALGSIYSAACTFTLSGGAGASTLWQTLRIADNYQLANRAVAFSARVRTSTASAVRIGIKDSVGAFTYSSFHTGDGTWQTLTVTATVAGAATYVYTALAFSVSCTAYLDNAMLVVGSVAADYAPLHPADDLARCLRYYEVLGDAANDMCVNSYHSAGAVFQIPVRFKANKAVTPTMTKVGTWSVTNCAQPGAGSPGVGGFVLFSTVTATAGFTFINDAVGKNIVAEGNP